MIKKKSSHFAVGTINSVTLFFSVLYNCNSVKIFLTGNGTGGESIYGGMFNG